MHVRYKTGMASISQLVFYTIFYVFVEKFVNPLSIKVKPADTRELQNIAHHVCVYSSIDYIYSQGGEYIIYGSRF